MSDGPAPEPTEPDSDATPVETTPEADSPARPGFVRRHRRAVSIGVGIVVVVLLFIGITGFTGLSGPGPLQRFRYSELSELADAINTNAGEYRTPDDCWSAISDTGGPPRDIARVDYLRSRVVVRLYTRTGGLIDKGTRVLAGREIDDVMAELPGTSWDMVEIEASPDGWSPTLSCRIATGGEVNGF